MEVEDKKIFSDKKLGLIFSLSIPLLLLIGIVLSLVQVQQPQQSDTKAAYRLANCDVPDADMLIKSAEQKLLDDMNTYRAQQAGAPPLTMSAELKRAAQWFANDMKLKNYLEFTDSFGRNTGQRLADCGFTGNTISATSIQQGNTAPEVVISIWKGEQGDNESILNPRFTVVGIAQSGPYWVATYADSSPAINPTLITIQPNPTENSGPPPSTPPTMVLQPTDPVGNQPTDKPQPTNAPEPTDVPGTTPTSMPPQAINMQITVSVKIPAIGKGGNLFPKHLSRRVIVTLFDVENKEVKKGTGFLTYDRNDLFTGTVNLGTLYEGKYYIKAAVQEQVLPGVIKSVTLLSTIQPKFQMLKANTNNILPPVILTQGDLDGDNKLSLNDYKLALVCFQTKGCVRDPALGDTYNMIDFNDDDKVNVTDYNVLLRSFFERRGN